MGRATRARRRGAALVAHSLSGGDVATVSAAVDLARGAALPPHVPSSVGRRMLDARLESGAGIPRPVASSGEGSESEDDPPEPGRAAGGAGPSPAGNSRAGAAPPGTSPATASLRKRSHSMMTRSVERPRGE